MSCVFCGESYSPEGQFRSGKFHCRSCGREWILEKRRNVRARPPEGPSLSNEVLLEFLSLFNTSPNLDDLLKNFTALAFRKLGQPGISVMVYEPRLDKILVKSYRNRKGGSLEKVAFRMEIRKGEDSGPLSQCVDTCKSVYYRFQEQKIKQFRQYGRLNGAVSALAVPIHLKKEVLGLISVDYEEDNPYQAEKDRYFLELIASQFAVTLKNRILFEVSQTQSRNFRNLHSAALKLSSLGFKYRTEIFRVILLSLTEFSENEIYAIIEKTNGKNGKNPLYEGHFLFKGHKALEIKLSQKLEGRWESLLEHKENVKLLESKEIPEWENLGFKASHIAILPVLHEEESDIWILLSKALNLHWSPEEIDVLNAFSIQAGISIQNFRLFHQSAEKERLDREIEIAKELQLSLLPRKMPEHPGYDFAGVMRAAIGVGGDYYDFITDPRNKETYICVGDVSGKGVPAGIVMATVRTVIHSLVRLSPAPWEIIETVNTYLYQNYFRDLLTPRFMSLTMIHWDRSGNRFRFSGGGQGHILVFRRSTNSIEEIPTEGIVLGIDSEISQFKNAGEFSLDPGDFFLMCTDGVWEASNFQGECFEMNRLEDCVLKNKDLSISILLEKILEEIKHFTGEKVQADDITLVGMSRHS
ncbi:serine/threonine protein phosphatase [Leptospira perolatii]|uniref:Serine/threonine protein phosphatase n=1 Tax=Leptospira perolatii TaxID=2023191 RepID=A0A2M9ZRG7_9LEPT|nr:GAF domain-containing SpoIIE family protein phosphatase [Leptospira perolatii]PJZ71120.1 serine/threonine protein phosphatase [Leptospira perolatii]PJZ74652.1 serine/threonine protein phosphatase [Leptospira perolatii]